MARSTEKSSLTKTYLSAATIVVLLGLIASGLALGLRPLESRAARVLDQGAINVRIAWPVARGGSGTWLPKPTQELLVSLAHDAAGQSNEVLTLSQLERMGAAMEQCGWFEGVPRITRSAKGVIEINGAWRIPAANVVHGGETYLVSWDGKPMPPGVRTTQTILNPAVGPPRDPAGDRDYLRPWAGEDMAASLELLGKLGAEPWSGQVKAIDAGEYANGGGLVIVTDKDTKVVFGGRPSKPRLGEATTVQKIEHLRQLFRDTKRIDAGYPLIYVNRERMQFDISATASQQQALAQEPRP